MSDCLTGNQFEIIANAKQALLDSTNIDTSPNEMACLDSFLFRCWQMGWLDKYEKDLVEVVRCKDCRYWLDDGIMTTCDKNIGNGYDAEYYCADGKRKEQEHEH